jgi:hypothetical protein
MRRARRKHAWAGGLGFAVHGLNRRCLCPFPSGSDRIASGALRFERFEARDPGVQVKQRLRAKARPEHDRRPIASALKERRDPRLSF